MRHDQFILADDPPPARSATAVDGAAPETRPAAGARSLTIATLGALVFLVYELTESEMAAAIAGGMKFGWDDISDGIWLFRRDPRKLRGALLMLVQTSRGAYSAALVACGVAAAADFIISWVGGKPPNLTSLTVFALGSAAVCVLLTVVWFLLVLWSGQRVWAGGGVAKFRKANEWPPRPRGRNSAPALLGATAYFLVTGLAAVVLLAVRMPGPAWPGLPGVSILAITLGVGAAFFAGWLGRRLTARFAEECWPEEAR